MLEMSLAIPRAEKNKLFFTRLDMLKLLQLTVVAFAVAHTLSNKNDFAFKFQQSGYHVTTERAEMVRYDKQYMMYASITPFKYNRTSAAINVTLAFNVDFGHRLEGVVQAYKFMSNEYRHFPLRFQLNLCDAFDANIGGFASTNKCGNFSGCPIQKGVIHICNWAPDESQFPPLVPTGRYMIEVQFLYLNKEVFLSHLYAAITRPIV